MLLNESNLATLFVGFKSAFNKGFEGAPSHVGTVSMRVPSGTRQEEYGWLKNLTGFRKWVGDRVVSKLAMDGFTIKNEDFEHTVSVERNDIADDQYGVLAPLFEEMGRLSREHPDTLIFDLIGRGFTELAYDGQLFFDTDHPVTDAEGNVFSASNFGGGDGPAWYLIDAGKSMKPLIFQVREDYEMVSLDKPNDENVFMRKEFLYGVHARVNAGFGLWQLAYASRQPLTPDNYAAARQALHEIPGDGGRKLNVMGTHLIVPPSLEKAGRQILVSGSRVEQTGAPAGDTTHVSVTNEWSGSAELIVTPYL